METYLTNYIIPEAKYYFSAFDQAENGSWINYLCSLTKFKPEHLSIEQWSLVSRHKLLARPMDKNRGHRTESELEMVKSYYAVTKLMKNLQV